MGWPRQQTQLDFKKKKYPLSNNQLQLIFFACLSPFSCLMIYTVCLGLWIRDHISQPRQLNRGASKRGGLFEVNSKPTFNGQKKKHYRVRDSILSTGSRLKGAKRTAAAEHLCLTVVSFNSHIPWTLPNNQSFLRSSRKLPQVEEINFMLWESG